MDAKEHLKRAQIYFEKAATHLALSMQAFEDAEAIIGTKPEPVCLTLYVDGGSRGNPGEGYGSYAIFEEDGAAPTAEDSRVFGQDMTNNEAEYDALLWGLERLHWTTGWCVPSNTDLTIKTDSALVCGQLRREKPWKVNADNLRERVRKAKELLADFAFWHIEKIPRAKAEAVLGH